MSSSPHHRRVALRRNLHHGDGFGGLPPPSLLGQPVASIESEWSEPGVILKAPRGNECLRFLWPS